MPSILPILRARRERRIARRHEREARSRRFILTAGMFLSLLTAALFLTTAFFYADLTRDLPSPQLLPLLLTPPDGLLLQPSRITDRTGEHILYTFAPFNSPRRYVPLPPTNPQHLASFLADAVIARADPDFWQHGGCNPASLGNPSHRTLAQRLISDLLIFNEPPSLRRALRECFLALQITAQFGRTQVLEWYLNAANFGHYAFGAEAAAQLYFGKSAAELTVAEAAILAAVSEAPSLNPHDAPQTALERGEETIRRMSALGMLSNEATANALGESPRFQPPPPTPPQPAPAFINLLLAQLETQFPRERLERGGLTIVSTLDLDLQKSASCITVFYAARLAGRPEPFLECPALGYLSALPPGLTPTDASAAAILTDPQTGQVLALVGETFQGQETPLLGAHSPGSVLDAFIYLTAFTRGLSPASLIWDIPGKTSIQNFDGVYHGPLRLRVALANDYPAPAAQVLAQMGVESVAKIAESFGVSREEPLSLVKAAGAYGVLAQNGVYFGQKVGEDFVPVTVLRVQGGDGRLWLDWSMPQAKPVVTPGLAYLVNHVLSDESARTGWRRDTPTLDVGRPAAVTVGQTAESLDTWAIGYSPLRVAAVWTGSRSGGLSPRAPAVLWNALMQLASQNLPPEDWKRPPEVSVINVCDPSGMLPTPDCPNIVNEVFLSGNEPQQADQMYRRFAVNRETNLLATVFTLPQLVEERVYLVVPPEARAWAESAGLAIPPSAYDVIQAPPFNPDVHISSPELFAEVSGVVRIEGTAAGADFVSYRVLVGQGLNPRQWLQIAEGTEPVTDGLLAEWEAGPASGLYAVQLQVLRSDQRVETALIQVTVTQR